MLPRLSILLTAALAPLFAQLPSPDELHRLTTEVSAITGLIVKRPVPAEALSRAEWKKWVDDEIKRSVKPEEIRASELALKKLGLLPQDFDLRQATADLYGEQAAAVYDPRRKKMLFVEGSATGAMGDAVILHELTHAVADQHFDMRRFLDKGAPNDEAQTARMAVVEGQAMWVMVESQMRKMGRSLKDDRKTLDAMLPAMGQLAADSYPVFSKAPLYLRESLLFPYSAGLLFHQSVFERRGADAIASVLRTPPVSSRQVLHPEAYFAGELPLKVTLPALPRPKDYDRVTNGSLGELDFKILFKQYTEDKDGEAASDWRGGAFELHARKRDASETLLRWTVEWSSPEAARTALRLYRTVLTGKAPKTTFSTETDTELSGTAPDGLFRIVVDGSRVSALEGLPR